MAAGTTVEPVLETLSRNHLECGICKERYSQPKILACLHSFCQACLEHYHTRRYDGARKISCPLCRQEMLLPEQGVSALKTNFFITSLMADIDLQRQVAQAATTCEICQQTKAVSHRCLDCSRNICRGCLQAHRQFPDLLRHEVATLKDIREGKVALGRKRKNADEPSCEKHPGEVRRFFCETCDVLICRDCTVVDHPSSAGHCYSNRNMASHTRR
ncbi:E3 ubiquitin-protein ligase TRIM56-like [Acanthaster planci]|uniref:E3 ubiquitin-protein ligase TRIM56-like n=1 Tax=Acanthaster planci TaxID=133434 RepID=A0A8B7Z0W4_ACAPL|nr:E3 ubiquitin-protein ligase TRIM56-like [Acanthaster planci]